MSQDTGESKIDSLLERTAATDVPVLLKAKEEAKRRVKDDPTAANLQALSRASQMLSDAVGGVQTLKAVKDVLAYLQGDGRKVSQSQLYKDIKQGALRRQKDGSFRQRDVDLYASTLPTLALPDAVQTDLGDLARRELEEKVAKTRAQRLSIEFDREIKQGKYILRDDVALELASRAATLDMVLRSTFRLYAADYIRLVGGDVSLVEELATEFEKNLNAALTEFSRPMDFSSDFYDEQLQGEKGEEAKAETDGE